MEFLRIPHHLVSDDKEIQTDCFECGHEKHYIRTDGTTYYCQRCSVTGNAQHLQAAMLEWVVKQSEGKADDYWHTRGFEERTIRRFRLGFYQALQRYTIPYLSEEGVRNISFRASTDTQDPKYIRLPSVPASVFEIAGEGSNEVLIAEGELDAISVWQADADKYSRILGIPGASFVNDRLVQSIPAGSKVSAIVDSDAAGKKAAAKLRERIPSIRFHGLPDGIKDVNEILVGQDEAAVRSSLSVHIETGNVGQEEVSGVPSSVYVTLPDEQGDWLIKDVWMDQALGFIAGIPKAMKSILALHLGFCVAEGIPFVTKEIVRPGPVLLFQEEDNDHLIKSRLRTIGTGHGSNHLWLFTPGITERHLRLDSDDAVEMLDYAIQKIAPVLVILDPLANMHSLEDENNAGQINKILERIRYIRDLRKCAFMIVHHMRKEGLGSGTNAGQKMRGSSVFHAKAESALYIERYGNLLRLEVENKLQPGRVLEIRYSGKEFTLEDELGEGVGDDADAKGQAGDRTSTASLH